jgi:hypothetical protein
MRYSSGIMAALLTERFSTIGVAEAMDRVLSRSGVDGFGTRELDS